jgi:hypothetical protein
MESYAEFLAGSLRYVGLVLPMLGIVSIANADEQDLRAKADSILGLLSKGETGTIASLLHYPPSYTEQQRNDDVADVHEQLDFLSQRFGKISHAVLAKEHLETLDIGVSGGTSEYFDSLDSFEYVDFTYATTFAHEGAGAIKIAFLRLKTGLVPWRISFCLLKSGPDASARFNSILGEISTHRKIGL